MPKGRHESRLETISEVPDFGEPLEFFELDTIETGGLIQAGKVQLKEGEVGIESNSESEEEGFVSFVEKEHDFEFRSPGDVRAKSSLDLKA